MLPNAPETADLVTFTEEILMENFILCAMGGSTTITVRMEYLFAFQFWNCELFVNYEGKAERIFLLIFVP